LSSRNLPNELKAAVESILGVNSSALRSQSAELRDAYGRAGSSSDVSIEAYLATRLPATYAAVSRVFELVDEILPEFAPQSLLDIGAGPGTASWAAVARWAELADVTMLERDNRFATIAQDFAKASVHPALQAARVERAEISNLDASAELVAAAYVFAEQREAMAGELALKLWRACSGLLIIVEPGTPDGFARIRAARSRLLGAGAFMVAPCTQSNECPMEGADWCHFKTRLQRSKIHMQAKGASVPFEDESFSFLAVSRVAAQLPEARIIAPPSNNKVGTSLKLCGHGGIEEQLVAARDKPAYKLSKKKGWGDSWQ
jgi:ribosomal protein RSM22 (predicted rRNA methylase)